MTEALLANAVVALATGVQVVVGIGFGMIAGPLLAIISLDYVPVPLLLNMLVVAIGMMASGRADVDWPSMPKLLPAILVGTIAAALLLGRIDKATFGLIFGCVIVAAVSLSLLGFRLERTPPALLTFGFFSGIAGTIAGLHGVPLAIIYQSASPRVVRATIAFVFIVGCIFALFALYWQGLFDQDALQRGTMTLPGVAVGYAIALVLQNRIPDRFARIAMLTIAGVSGAWLVIHSVG